MVNNESDYMCFSFQIDVCFSTTLEKTVDTQRNTVITNLVKKNYFMSQVDKYIYKYDVNKMKVISWEIQAKNRQKCGML